MKNQAFVNNTAETQERFYPWTLCPLMVYYKYKKTTAPKVGLPNE